MLRFLVKTISVLDRTESALTGITDFNFEKLGEAGSDKWDRVEVGFLTFLMYIVM